MNLLILLLSFMLSGGATITKNKVVDDTYGCITAEKIAWPLEFWAVRSTELKNIDGTLFLEISVHNPLNKTSTTVDAKFLLAIDPAAPMDPNRYTLVGAVYYNTKTQVVFERVLVPKAVIAGNLIKQFLIQTPCFSRIVTPVMNIKDSNDSLKKGEKK